MPPPAKKDGLAVLAVAKPDGDKPYGHDEPDADDYEEPVNGGADFDGTAERLGQMLNVPEGHRDEFKVTLKEAIHACVRGYQDERE